jgi:hypothetical protein
MSRFLKTLLTITIGNEIRKIHSALCKVVKLIDASQLVRNSDLVCKKPLIIEVSKACGNYIEGSLGYLVYDIYLLYIHTLRAICFTKS